MCCRELRTPAGRHILKSLLHLAIPLHLVFIKPLMPCSGLLACVLQVGLRYDMMELIKLLNAENKVSNEYKRKNTYRLLLLKEGLCTGHWLARALAQARVDPTKLCVGDTRSDHSIENRLPTVLLGPHPHHRHVVQRRRNGVRCVRM